MLFGCFLFSFGFLGLLLCHLIGFVFFCVLGIYPVFQIVDVMSSSIYLPVVRVLAISRLSKFYCDVIGL